MPLQPDPESLRDADRADAFRSECEAFRMKVKDAASRCRTKGGVEALEYLDDAFADAIGALENEAERLREDALETAAEYAAELRR